MIEFYVFALSISLGALTGVVAYLFREIKKLKEKLNDQPNNQS